MISSVLRLSRRAVGAACCSCFFFSFGVAARTLFKQGPPAQSSAKESREQGPQQRIPRQQAQNTAALDGFVRDASSPNNPLPVPGTVLPLRNLESGKVFSATSSAEGVFRLFPLPPGKYELHTEAQSYAPFVLTDLVLKPNEIVTLEISMVSSGSAGANTRLPRLPELGPALSAEAAEPSGMYRELRHRLDSDPNYVGNTSPEMLPPVAHVYHAVPNRRALQQPDYRRYSQKGEYVYVKPRWYDPFNRNRFKGDEPIWPQLFGQQVFLNLTASAETFFEGRRVPSPSNVSSARPGSADFFGKGEQEFFDQTLRFAFDFFQGHGSFKPADWRIRITPEFSLNDLNVNAPV